jgi:hypothetical protein
MACDEWSLWRGNLLPPRCVATLKSATGVRQGWRNYRVYGGYAAEREQAPSPQGGG